MRAFRFLFVAGVVVIILAAGFAAFAWRPPIATIDPPAKSAFDLRLVKRGAVLAAIGNCNTCHTIQGGRAFAGGVPLATPFGTIYGTNVTPDPDTGIGRWSEEAFRRAMREGLDRAGRHLYPAFPYDHFTKLVDDDIKALYAFMMTREPMRAETPENPLPFPFNIRALLAGWKLLFLERGPDRLAQTRGSDWDRGAYLVDALAHCGACHTPRNALGAEKRNQYLAGGSIEGWHAPALNAQSPAPVPWDADELVAYLRGGSELHGSAAGPMAPVVQNLKDVPESEVRAIAAYLAAVIGKPSPERRRDASERIARAHEIDTVGTAPSGDANAQNAALFAGACAVCHSAASAAGARAAIPLALSSAITGPDPRNAIRVVLEGIHPPDGETGASMPGFAGALTEQQITALVSYLRSRFGNKPPWPDLAAHVRKIMQGGDQS